MLIKKGFRIVLSGAYQSYEFQTSIEEEFDIKLTDENDVIAASETLQSLAVDSVARDIEAHKMYDEKFKTVCDVRADQLAKAAKIIKQ
jgi:hypothetical protein